jgi:hypothetical protein
MLRSCLSCNQINIIRKIGSIRMRLERCVVSMEEKRRKTYNIQMDLKGAGWNGAD